MRLIQTGVVLVALLALSSGTDNEGDLVEFYPTVSGKYRFSILYGEVPIPGEFFFILMGNYALIHYIMVYI